MGDPVNKFATCFYCGKRLRWDRPHLTEAQRIENKAVDDFNASLGFDERSKRKPRPHDTPSSYQRWTHATEQPGEDKVPCEGQDEETSYWNHKRATPLEFCTEDINAYGYGERTCNVRSKERAEWEQFSKVPMCGRHLGPLKKQVRENQERAERRELQAWIQTEIGKMCDLLFESYGLEARQEYDFHSHQYTGKIIVDPKKLLDILKEEVF